MSEHETGDFDAQLAAVERFIADVQQGSVPTGEAMRAYRDVHRPAIERLRAQLAEFEALLAQAGVADAAQAPDVSSSSA
jgi:chorismate-pyruvate lyase